MNDALESLQGRLIKVVYSDSGEVKVRKGQLVGLDDHFITVRTFNHTYAIARPQIIELKTLEGER